jgi:ribonuclease HII
MTGKSVYIGIDEVGRGPLAGPVEVGAVLVCGDMLQKFKIAIKHSEIPMRDSKKLSEKQRKEWKKYLAVMKKKKIIHYATARMSSRVIDAVNISRATGKAAEKAIGTVLKASRSSRAAVRIFSDAGIRPDISHIPSKNVRFTAHVRGDETIPLISLASILAKVSRDAYMTAYAAKHPEYHFDANKGYGTPDHIRAVRAHGPSPIHRLTFLGNFSKME